MSEERMKTEARKARREREVGEGAVCVHCGEADPVALVSKGKSLIEDHHVFGKNHDGALTVPLCRNCHAKTHESYRRALVQLETQPSLLERLAAMLRALGSFLSELGGRLRDWAEQLLDFVEWLDVRVPDWRSALEVA